MTAKTKYVLARTFIDQGQFEHTTILGIWASPLVAMAYTAGLIEETRKSVEWEDKPAEWAWVNERDQWITQDFPDDMGSLHVYTLQPTR
jgi:hypothetical protein